MIINTDNWLAETITDFWSLDFKPVDKTQLHLHRRHFKLALSSNSKTKPSSQTNHNSSHHFAQNKLFSFSEPIGNCSLKFNAQRWQRLSDHETARVKNTSDCLQSSSELSFRPSCIGLGLRDVDSRRWRPLSKPSYLPWLPLLSCDRLSPLSATPSRGLLPADRLPLFCGVRLPSRAEL